MMRKDGTSSSVRKQIAMIWKLEKFEFTAFSAGARSTNDQDRQTTTAPLMTAAPHDDPDEREEPSPYSDLSTFQNSGVAGPSSTPVSDLRQPLGRRYCPSGM